MHEMTSMKLVEVLFEALPNAVMQCWYFFKKREIGGGGGWGGEDIAHILSIVTSVMATGFTCGVIQYDMDVDPAMRKQDPQFWGIISDSAKIRLLTFLSLIANSALLMLSRSLIWTFLLRSGDGLWVTVLGSELLLYFVWKLYKRDMIHTIRVDGCLAASIASFFLRLFGKIICDFTGILFLRSPSELGGLYYSFNMIMTQVLLVVSTNVYGARCGCTYVGKREVAIIVIAWSVNIVLMLSMIKGKYLQSFYDPTSGVRKARSWFLEAEREGDKARIFSIQSMHWVDLRDDVKEWVANNWQQWQQNRPDWLNGKILSSIDGDLVPVGMFERLSQEYKGNGINTEDFANGDNSGNIGKRKSR